MPAQPAIVPSAAVHQLWLMLRADTTAAVEEGRSASSCVPRRDSCLCFCVPSRAKAPKSSGKRHVLVNKLQLWEHILKCLCWYLLGAVEP